MKRNLNIILLSLVYLLNLSIGILHFFKFLSITLSSISILVTTIIAIYFSFETLQKKERIRSSFLYLAIIIFVWSFFKINLASGNKIMYVIFTQMLFPSLSGIPLLIGFIWLIGLIISIGFVYTIGMARGNINLSALFVGTISTIYAFLLEPAAQKLGYWGWYESKVNYEYYFIWFLFSSLFGFIGYKMEIFDKIKSKWIIQIAIAQIIGFTIAQISR